MGGSQQRLALRQGSDGFGQMVAQLGNRYSVEHRFASLFGKSPFLRLETFRVSAMFFIATRKVLRAIIHETGS